MGWGDWGEWSDLPQIIKYIPVDNYIEGFVGENRLFAIYLNKYAVIDWIHVTPSGETITIEGELIPFLYSYYFVKHAETGTHIIKAKTGDDILMIWNWFVQGFTPAPIVSLYAPGNSNLSLPAGISQDFTVTVSKGNNEAATVKFILDGELVLETPVSNDLATYQMLSVPAGAHTIKVIAQTTVESDPKYWYFVGIEESNPIYPEMVISRSNPSSQDVSSFIGETVEFVTIANQTCNIKFLLNGNMVQENQSIQTASYINDSASTGEYDLTVIAENENGDVDATNWTWNVQNQEEQINVNLYFEPEFAEYGIPSFELKSSESEQFTIESVGDKLWKLSGTFNCVHTSIPSEIGKNLIGIGFVAGNTEIPSVVISKNAFDYDISVANIKLWLTDGNGNKRNAFTDGDIKPIAENVLSENMVTQNDLVTINLNDTNKSLMPMKEIFFPFYKDHDEILNETSIVSRKNLIDSIGAKFNIEIDLSEIIAGQIIDRLAGFLPKVVFEYDLVFSAYVSYGDPQPNACLMIDSYNASETIVKLLIAFNACMQLVTELYMPPSPKLWMKIVNYISLYQPISDMIGLLPEEVTDALFHDDKSQFLRVNMISDEYSE